MLLFFLGKVVFKIDNKYVCSHCGSKFTDWSNAMRHFKHMHTPQKPVNCTICGKEFKYLAYARKHLAKFHGVRKNKLRNDFINLKKVQH